MLLMERDCWRVTGRRLGLSCKIIRWSMQCFCCTTTAATHSGRGCLLACLLACLLSSHFGSSSTRLVYESAAGFSMLCHGLSIFFDFIQASKLSSVEEVLSKNQHSSNTIDLHPQCYFTHHILHVGIDPTHAYTVKSFFRSRMMGPASGIKGCFRCSVAYSNPASQSNRFSYLLAQKAYLLLTD